MNDKKSAEEDLFVDDFGAGEEFDFGEAKEAEPTPTPTGGPRGPNKSVLGFVVIIAIIVAVYFGYRYFYAGSASSTKTAATTPIATTPSAANNKAGTTTKAGTTPAIRTSTGKTPTSAPGKPLFPSKEESAFTESEIASAMEANKSAPPPAQTATKPAPPASATAGTPGGPFKNLPAPQTAKTATAQTQTATKTTPTTELGAELPFTTTATAAHAAPEPVAESHVNVPGTPSGATATTAAPVVHPAMTTPATPHFPETLPTTNETTATPVTTTGTTAITATTEKAAIPEKTVTKASTPSTDSEMLKKAPEKLSPVEIEQLNKTMEALSKLNQQMENNLNQIKYLDAYTREITETVGKLNSQISAMDNRILALTNTANSLSKDVGSVRSEVGSVKRALGDEGLFIEPVATAAGGPGKAGVAVGKEEILYTNSVPKKCAVVAEEPEFMLHAVIPGRAWLKSSNGQIVTVTEGDVIGNYGKIIIIDAANGVVLTNSGITFR